MIEPIIQHLKSSYICPECSNRLLIKDLDEFKCNNCEDYINNNLLKTFEENLILLDNYKIAKSYISTSYAIKEYKNKENFIKSNLGPSYNELLLNIKKNEGEYILRNKKLTSSIVKLSNFIINEYYGRYSDNPIVGRYNNIINLDIDPDGLPNLNLIDNVTIDLSELDLEFSYLKIGGQDKSRELIMESITESDNKLCEKTQIISQNSSYLTKLFKTLNKQMNKVNQTQYFFDHSKEFLFKEVEEYLNSSLYKEYKNSQNSLNRKIEKIEYDVDLAMMKGVYLPFWKGVSAYLSGSLFEQSWKYKVSKSEFREEYQSLIDELGLNYPKAIDDLFENEEDYFNEKKEIEIRSFLELKNIEEHKDIADLMNDFIDVLELIK